MAAEVIEREAKQHLFASPLPSLLLAGDIPTSQRNENFGVLPAAIPPTIVRQRTLDPKTPYRVAEEHVATLKTAGDIQLTGRPISTSCRRRTSSRD